MATAEGDDREAAALLDQSTGDEDADTVELRLGENEDSFFDSDRSEAVPKGGSRCSSEKESREKRLSLWLRYQWVGPQAVQARLVKTQLLPAYRCRWAGR